jgi:hypothetical protein
MGQIGDNITSSLLGNATKGYLLIKKAETSAPEPSGTNMPIKNANSTLGSVAAAASAAKGAAAAASALQNAAAGLASAVSRFSNDIMATATAQGYIPMQVQYNPSSIQMSTMKGDILNHSTGAGGENSFQQWKVPLRTTLAVELYLDDMNLVDAFNYETSMTGLSETAKQLVTSASGSSYSVRPIVEALVGAVGKAESRQAVFVWNQMAFEGELVGVEAEYLMFNRLGEPIRAKVGIQIYQKDKLASDYWDDAYEALFQSSSSLTGTGNVVSNLVNLR